MINCLAKIDSKQLLHTLFLVVSSRGGLVVELWTDNSLPSATVVQIPVKYGVLIVQMRRLFVAHSYGCRMPESLLFMICNG